MEINYEKLKEIVAILTEESLATNAKAKKYKDIKEDKLVMLIANTEEYKAGSVFIKRSSKLAKTLAINNKDLKSSKFVGVIVKLINSNEIIECTPADSKLGLYIELTKIKYEGKSLATKGSNITFKDKWNRYFLTLGTATLTISTDRPDVRYLLNIKEDKVHLIKKVGDTEIFSSQCIKRSLADVELMLKLFNHSHYYHLTNNTEAYKLVNMEIINIFPTIDKKSIMGFSEYIYKGTPVDYLTRTKLTVQFNMLYIASVIGIEQLELLYRKYLTNSHEVEDLAKLL